MAMRHVAPFILFLVSVFLAVTWPLIRPEDTTDAYALGLAISLGVYLTWVILVIRDKFKNNNGDDDSSNFYEPYRSPRDNSVNHPSVGNVDGIHAGILPRATGRDEPLAKDAQGGISEEGERTAGKRSGERGASREEEKRTNPNRKTR